MEISISNNNSIELDAIIEAPIGTLVCKEKIPANSLKSFSADKDDIPSARIEMQASGHEPETILFEYKSTTYPFTLYIQKVNIVAIIGSIHGTALFSF